MLLKGAAENPNFVEAYSTIRSDLRKNLEAESFLQQLCRYVRVIVIVIVKVIVKVFVFFALQLHLSALLLC